MQTANAESSLYEEHEIYTPPPTPYAQALLAAYQIYPTLVEIQQVAINKLNEGSVVPFREWIEGKRWPKRPDNLTEAGYLRQAYTLLFDPSKDEGLQSLYPVEMCAAVTKRIKEGIPTANSRAERFEDSLLQAKKQNEEARQQWLAKCDAAEEKGYQQLIDFHVKRQSLQHVPALFSKRMETKPVPNDEELAQIDADWNNFQQQWDAIQRPPYLPRPHIKELLQLDEDQVEWNKREKFLDSEFATLETDVLDEMNKFLLKANIPVVSLPSIAKIGKRYLTLPWISQSAALEQVEEDSTE